jgi:hypothetical protein
MHAPLASHVPPLCPPPWVRRGGAEREQAHRRRRHRRRHRHRRHRRHRRRRCCSCRYRGRQAEDLHVEGVEGAQGRQAGGGGRQAEEPQVQPRAGETTEELHAEGAEGAQRPHAQLLPSLPPRRLQRPPHFIVAVHSIGRISVAARLCSNPLGRTCSRTTNIVLHDLRLLAAPCWQL